MNKLDLKKILCCLLLAMSFIITNAQEEATPVEDKVVGEHFDCSMLIENQTVVSPYEKGFEFIIHHRMGSVKNNFSDLFGMFGASNIRLGVQYGITDEIMIGFGTEKTNQLQEFQAKYAAFQQTESGSIPVSVSVYANACIDAREKDAFGADYKTIHRISYFSQIIVSRKFSNNFSLQLAPSYSHFNAVDTSNFQHGNIGVMLGGRYKVTSSLGITAEYHHPFRINPLRGNQKDIEPGVALGLEIATGTHVFQIFATTYKDIVPQRNYVMNTNKVDSEGILIGFNVTVRF